MPRKKKDEVSVETQFLSLHIQLDRALKLLGMHAAYVDVCDDIRSLLKLTKPTADDILDRRLVKVGNDTRH